MWNCSYVLLTAFLPIKCMVAEETSQINIMTLSSALTRSISQPKIYWNQTQQYSSRRMTRTRLTLKRWVSTMIYAFLTIFADELKILNSNYFGIIIIDQMVASKGDIFFGTTFFLRRHLMWIACEATTVHGINCRGTSWVKCNPFTFLHAIENTLWQNTFHRDKACGNLDFPMGWRDIDHGISEIW